MPTYRNLQASSILVALCLGVGCTSTRSELKGETSAPAAPGDSLSSHDMYGVSGGEPDRDNLWETTVRVRSNVGMCSGILIAPKAVITAAHCFCPVTQAAIDRSKCAKRATVTKHFYLYQLDKKRWEPIPTTSQGDVIIHENFTTQRNSQGNVDHGKHDADIAIVALDKELDGLKPDVFLRAKDVSERDELTIIGYGPTTTNGDDGNVRRYGTNHVSTVTKFPNGRVGEFRFNAAGAHTHNGDSGGPAVSFDEGKRWLVGINGGYSETGEQSWFTATAIYYGWITSQLEKAGRPRAP